MKSASTAVCTPQRGPAVGRVHRRDHSEVQLYLSKLRRLLPTRPGARRLTKLEVIQSVIEYICDLQHCLQMPLDAVDASVKATVPSPAEVDDRTAPISGEHEPTLQEADHHQLFTVPTEADDVELEEEDEEEDDEDLEDDAEAESAPTIAPAAMQERGLPVLC